MLTKSLPSILARLGGKTIRSFALPASLGVDLEDDEDASDGTGELGERSRSTFFARGGEDAAEDTAEHAEDEDPAPDSSDELGSELFARRGNNVAFCRPARAGLHGLTGSSHPLDGGHDRGGKSGSRVVGVYFFFDKTKEMRRNDFSILMICFNMSTLILFRI